MHPTIFHEAWWLDAAAPEGWQEVVVARGGQTEGYLRFVSGMRAGLKVCGMPQLTRILGPVVNSQAEKVESRNRANHLIISSLLDQVDVFDSVSMVLPPSFEDLLPFLEKGYEVGVQPTLSIDCTQPIETIWLGMRDKTRNSVRRARETLTVREIENAKVFSTFYGNNLQGETSYFDMSLIDPIYEAARKRGSGTIFAAVDDANRPHAMVFLVHDNHCIYYFLSTRDKGMAHVGAVSLLVWAGIELAHKLRLTFDFDGITNSARFQFMAGFGSGFSNRYTVRRESAIYKTQEHLRSIARVILKPKQRRA